MKNLIEYQAKGVSIKKLFHCLSGNNGLTEELIYKNIDLHNQKLKYDVLSSSTVENTKMGVIPKCSINGKEIRVFEETEGILVARNGRAGKFTYLKPGYYTINDHAYILYEKEQNKYDILLEWFAYAYQKVSFAFSSKSDNGTWNKTSFMKEVKVDIPTIYYQKKIINLYSKFNVQTEKLKALQLMLEKILSKHIEIIEESVDSIKLGQLIKYVSRNDVLSHEGIYNNGPKSSEEEVINVLSGSSDNIYFGKISKNTQRIHYIEGVPVLHVVSRGKAGKLTFLESGVYATNTNAFLLYLNPDLYSKLNISNEKELSSYLKYMQIILQPIFYEASSNSDLGVFPLTDLMKNLTVPLYKLNGEMQELVNKVDFLKEQVHKIDVLSYKMDKMQESEIL